MHTYRSAHKYVHIQTYRATYCKDGSWESVGQASRLVTQVRVGDGVWSLNSAGCSLKAQEEFLCSRLEENFFLGKPPSLLVRPSTDCMQPIHVTEDNLLSSDLSWVWGHMPVNPQDWGGSVRRIGSSRSAWAT